MGFKGGHIGYFSLLPLELCLMIFTYIVEMSTLKEIICTGHICRSFRYLLREHFSSPIQRKIIFPTTLSSYKILYNAIVMDYLDLSGDNLNGSNLSCLQRIPVINLSRTQNANLHQLQHVKHLTIDYTDLSQLSLSCLHSCITLSIKNCIIYNIELEKLLEIGKKLKSVDLGDICWSCNDYLLYLQKLYPDIYIKWNNFIPMSCDYDDDELSIWSPNEELQYSLTPGLIKFKNDYILN